MNKPSIFSFDNILVSVLIAVGIVLLCRIAGVLIWTALNYFK